MRYSDIHTLASLFVLDYSVTAMKSVVIFRIMAAQYYCHCLLKCHCHLKLVNFSLFTVMDAFI